MTILKRKAILLAKQKSTAKPAPKGTGKSIQGGKVVWVYQSQRLPYKAEHLDEQEIQHAVDQLPA